ncbi:DUF3426 domain-containing protein [Xanthomonas arboricola]|uniref:DUF3426 domain-containing protein n=1 Tax=Xanthomonas arboricola TaxID=56448 RepID=UPI000F8F7D23|nr:DUF3426 domain-containing protein [Xanthomonas arboricola]MBB4768115.1 hypothetical protein [Xanthomonas arboricola]
MSETPPPRRPLATFLRATPAAPSLIPTPVVPAADAPLHAPPVPAGALVPAPLAEAVAAPAAPLVPPPSAPPSAPPATAPRSDSVPVDILPPPGDAGQTAADTAEPDRLAWTTATTRQLPGDPAEDTAAGRSDTRSALAGTAPAQPTTAQPRDVAAAGVPGTARQREHGNASAPASDLAAPPAPGTDPDTDAEPSDNDAGAADAAAPAQFQPLPAEAAPAFARRGLSRPRLRASGRQWALLVGLVGLLALQIVIADRAQLAADARWRPLVSAACAVARCTLPAWREPAALTLLNREVRPLPGVPGVLQIQASFRNEARWAQAWPWLQLSLSDADGRVIGTRVLAPQEYLGQPPAAQDTLAPGQAVQVAFRVREPAASTAAFSFDFR